MYHGVHAEVREQLTQWSFLLRSAKLKRAGDLKNTLTSDVGMQSVAFAQLVSGFALVHCFLATLPLLPFGMVMYTLGYCLEEVHDLLF